MRRAALLLVLLAGCSASTAKPLESKHLPAHPTIATGTAGIAAGMPLIDIRSRLEDGPWVKGDAEFGWPWLSEGDRVLMLHDDGNEFDSDRWCEVKVESGTYDGNRYLMERKRFTRTPEATPRGRH